VVEKAFSRLCPWNGWTYSFALKRKVYGFQVVVLTWQDSGHLHSRNS